MPSIGMTQSHKSWWLHLCLSKWSRTSWISDALGLGRSKFRFSLITAGYQNVLGVYTHKLFKTYSKVLYPLFCYMCFHKTVEANNKLYANIYTDLQNPETWLKSACACFVCGFFLLCIDLCYCLVKFTQHHRVICDTCTVHTWWWVVWLQCHQCEAVHIVPMVMDGVWLCISVMVLGASRTGPAGRTGPTGLTLPDKLTCIW